MTKDRFELEGPALPPFSELMNLQSNRAAFLADRIYANLRFASKVNSAYMAAWRDFGARQMEAAQKTFGALNDVATSAAAPTDLAQLAGKQQEYGQTAMRGYLEHAKITLDCAGKFARDAFDAAEERFAAQGSATKNKDDGPVAKIAAAE